MAKENKNEKKYWLGFDLGGTKMLAVVFDQDFNKVERKKRKTRAFEGVEAGLDRIERSIADALDDAGISASQLSGIGVGAPGPLDPKKGILLDLPNLGWKNVKLKDRLEAKFKCTVTVANDVDSGVYGEYVSGAAKGSACAFGVFPGTGIGGGCVYDGDIIAGKRRSCMEIGHIPVDPMGRLCGCGNRGCLETVASRLTIASQIAAAAYRGEAPTVLEIAGTDLSNIRSSTIANAVSAGDTAVENIVRQSAEWLGMGLATAINLMLPDVVILGGGLVEAMPELYVKEVAASANAHVMSSFRDEYKIRAAKLGDDATALGAAAWAARQQNRKKS